MAAIKRVKKTANSKDAASAERSAVPVPPAPAPLNLEEIRRAFPILHQDIHGHPLVYLDNAATTQKPRAVIDAISRYYEHDNANVHRGVHELSNRATQAFEGARKRIAKWIHAKEEAEIIFTRGTTEGINLVAQTFGRGLKAGDEVLITHMEHHSNIVPWQMACQATGATLRVAPIDDNGALLMDEFEPMLSSKTKIVCVVHQSNSLGTINPIAEITKKAHAVGALVLVDGAQATSHNKIDVQALDVDFYAMSAHKAYGPTGIGALYGKRAILEKLPPWQGGGDMILSVTLEKTVYNKLPYYFEAGTPDIAGPVGWAAAIDWMESVGIENIAAHEQEILRYGTAALAEIPHIKLIGTAPHKASILAFVHDHVHPHDIGTILDREGVAIRTGHHCTQPVMARFGVPATARASLAVYNGKDDIDRLVKALLKVNEVFG